MDLKKGAVTKRWSRLKTSMDANQTPNGSVYRFLWLCVKHSTRDKVSAIADPTRRSSTTTENTGPRLERDRGAMRHHVRRGIEAVLPHEASFRSQRCAAGQQPIISCPKDAVKED
jgi:hypothetical protein